MVSYSARRYLVLVGLVILFWLGSILTEYLTSRPDPIYRHGDESRPVVALTFDDGPSSRFTPQILALLKNYQIHATFFLLGRHARRYPQVVQALAAQGHEIGNHTYSHLRLAKVNQATLAREMDQTEAVLGQLGARLNGLFRPPYSELSQAAVGYLKRTGRKIILWNVDSGDWRGYPATTIVARVLNNLKNGAIVVLHDNNEYDNANRQPTVDALRLLLPQMQKKGFRCLTVSELLKIY
ncbi:MAG: polysaccharide deacetylase family protein [Desulfobacca sp.]|nr:polysaccharide deacetylase family protein [Desulfobacca sp.]